MAVPRNDVQIGSVIHLDPEVLIRLGSVHTNTLSGTEVQEEHYFLVIDLIDGGDTVVALPLYSDKKDIRDRIILLDNHKGGKAENWTNRKSYYYKWQTWRFPIGSVEPASHNDDSEQGSRRTYGLDGSSALNGVIADARRNRDPWRKL